MGAKVPSLKFKVAVLAAVLFFLAGLSSPVYSATVHVSQNTGDDANTGENWESAVKTLGAALAIANRGDTIKMTEGIYNEQLTFKTGIKVYGNLPIPPSTTPTSTILDGTGLGAPVVIGANVNLITLDGVTVQNGLHGGIELVESEGTISNNLIRNNHARTGAGGGLYINNFTGLIYNNNLLGNIAINGGGVFAINCKADIRQNTFLNNGVTRNGGGAFFDKQENGSIIKWNYFEANGAKQGGGVFLTGKAQTFESNWIFSNRSEASGGGMYLLKLSGILKNLMVYKNHAHGSGGGFYMAHPENKPLLQNVTVADNTANASGYGLVTDGSVQIKNSIFWNKDQFGVSQDVYVSDEDDDAYLDISYSNTANPQFNGSNNNISDDPLLDSNYHLQDGSPAINTGEPLAADGSNANEVDIDGHWRFPGSGEIADRGADEAKRLDGSSSTCLDADQDGICAPDGRGNDCDDSDNTVFPDAVETCNGKDNNCNGIIDDPEMLTYSDYFLDNDGDGFGDPNVVDHNCGLATGFVENDNDCDDNDASVYPGAEEICEDNIDQDCDGVDLQVCDGDGDGFDLDTDCDDNDDTIYPGAPEICDGKHNDCDGPAPTDEGDTDGDGTIDCNESCPDDPDKLEPGICGCGVPDTDTDGDGINDCNDECPNNGGKTDPGVCGCETADTDTDGDGTPDCNDLCDNDPNKTEAGVCGCGVVDIDTDGDSTPDCNDGCPDDPDKLEPGICGCGQPDTDTDGDSTPDCVDLCELDPDKIAPGICGCGVPDTDTDGDGLLDCEDLCPDDSNKTDPGVCGCGTADTDTDGDGTPDCTESCDDDPDKIDPGICGCGVSDVDTDGDGVPDCNDCADSDSSRFPGNTEICDGIDNDCDGVVPSDETDDDGDGISECQGDCDDTNKRTYPGAPELCGDNADNDCDGKVDYEDDCEHHDVMIKNIKSRHRVKRCNKRHKIKIYIKNKARTMETAQVFLYMDGEVIHQWKLLLRKNRAITLKYHLDVSGYSGTSQLVARIDIPYDENPSDNTSATFDLVINCGVQQDAGKQDTGKQDTGKQDAGKQDAGKQDAGKQDADKQEGHDVKLVNIDVTNKMRKCDDEYKVTVHVKNKTSNQETAEVTLKKDGEVVKTWSSVNLGSNEQKAMDFMYKPSTFGDNRKRIKWTASITIADDEKPSDNSFGPKKSKVKCR